MKNTDAVVDRIQRRREKLERAGVFKPDIESLGKTAAHLWQVDLQGRVSRIGEHSDDLGIDIVALPSGKFLPEKHASLVREPFHLWNQHFAHLDEVPDQPPPVPQLLDAPPPPVLAPTAIIKNDENDATGVNDEYGRSLRPEEIDREAVLLDFAKHRKAALAAKGKDNLSNERADIAPPKPKARTYAERYNQIEAELAEAFERQRREQQAKDERPATPIAMGPTVGNGWKGH